MMKHFFYFLCCLLFLVAIVTPNITQASHTVDTVSPNIVDQTGSNQNNVALTVMLGGTLVTPAVSADVDIFDLSSSLAAVPGGSYDPDSPSPFPVLVDIPASSIAAGVYTVQVCYAVTVNNSQVIDCAEKANAFCVRAPNGSCPGLTGGGGGGGGGGDFGGGGVEPVPADYGGIPAGPGTGDEFVDLIEGVIDWVFIILLLLAIVFIVLAGLQFITGGGNPQSVAEARQKLIWAAIGIVVALLARGIPFVIRNVIAG